MRIAMDAYAVGIDKEQPMYTQTLQDENKSVQATRLILIYSKLGPYKLIMATIFYDDIIIHSYLFNSPRTK